MRTETGEHDIATVTIAPGQMMVLEHYGYDAEGREFETIVGIGTVQPDGSRVITEHLERGKFLVMKPTA